MKRLLARLRRGSPVPQTIIDGCCTLIVPAFVGPDDPVVVVFRIAGAL